MKTIYRLIGLISLFMIFVSCAKQSKESYGFVPLVNEEKVFFVSLEHPVPLINESSYNLHWNSNIPEHKVSYNLNINGELVKEHLTKTVISENENLIEFNVPVTDFSVPFEMLDTGNNTIQIFARYNNGEATYASNQIEIIHSKSSFAVSE